MWTLDVIISISETISAHLQEFGKNPHCFSSVWGTCGWFLEQMRWEHYNSCVLKQVVWSLVKTAGNLLCWNVCQAFYASRICSALFVMVLTFFFFSSFSLKTSKHIIPRTCHFKFKYCKWWHWPYLGICCTVMGFFV